MNNEQNDLTTMFDNTEKNIIDDNESSQSDFVVDPSTGQITDTQKNNDLNLNNNEPEVKFDSNTGQPLSSSTEMKFDPNTGQPLSSGTEMKFDPNTGQPLSSGTEMKFDPNTGQPLNNKSQDINNSVTTNKYNKNAIIAFVLSIVSLFIFWWLSLVSIGLCTTALKEIKEKGEKGKVFVFISYVISGICIALFVFSVIFKIYNS